MKGNYFGFFHRDLTNPGESGVQAGFSLRSDSPRAVPPEEITARTTLDANLRKFPWLLATGCRFGVRFLICVRERRSPRQKGAHPVHARRQFAALLILGGFFSPLFATGQDAAQPVTASVDERVELLSIVFRLAGNFEYNLDRLPGYSTDIDRWFAPYRNHPAVQMARSLGQRGIRYDAVMAMAISLSFPPDLTPLVPFQPGVPEPRWSVADSGQFLPLLRDFYRASRFADFFAAHHAMYRLAELRFAKTLAAVDFGWYVRFYGSAPDQSWRVVLGMNNGSGSYGLRLAYPDGRTERYSIVGCWSNDDSGEPTFPPGQDYLSTMVHEFSHSFVNPVVAANWSSFRDAGQLYAAVADPMRGLAYGDALTMVDESLVRAATIVYFQEEGEEGRRNLRRIREQQRLGFFWMDRLVDALDQYQRDRAQYPTFASWIPEAARFFEQLAPRAGAEAAAFDAKSAHVVQIEPLANHSQDVDASIRTVTIVVDKPLDRRAGYSINAAGNDNELYPIAGKPAFADDGRSIRLPVRLKPDQAYAFELTPLAFATPDGYPLASYKVEFRTRGAASHAQ
jgi:hypothetical protein